MRTLASDDFKPHLVGSGDWVELEGVTPADEVLRPHTARSIIALMMTDNGVERVHLLELVGDGDTGPYSLKIQFQKGAGRIIADSLYRAEAEL